MLYKKNELLNELCFEHPEILRLTFDSRDILPGDMFIALKGSNFDGHDFVEQALKKGAVCALVERYVCEGNIVVDSCLETLKKIAKFRRSLFKGKVFAITGSVGKTTTRNSLVKTLDQKFRVFHPLKNFNSQLGVPFSLAQADLEADFWVFELGMSLPNEISKLTNLVMPDYSILTEISSAHIDSFGTLFKILQEKMQIFDFTKSLAFFPENGWYSNLIKKYCKIRFETFLKGENSRESLLNLLEKIIKTLNLDLVPKIVELSGRREIINLKINSFGIKLIDSSYNANLSSMIDELKFFKKMHGKKIVILGDMFGQSEAYHKVLSLYLNDMICLLIGEKMKCLYLKLGEKNSFYFENENDLKEFLKIFINMDMNILVKGSGVMKMKNIVDFLCCFSDY